MLATTDDKVHLKCCQIVGYGVLYRVYCRRLAPVAQVDRAPAPGAGCERSSRSRGAFYDT